MTLTTRPSSSPDRPSPAVGATAPLPPAQPGTFDVLPDGDALTWSEPVYRLHAFEPGDVVPSVALMLSHCHRDDRAALEQLLRTAPDRSDEGRSVRYRLLDAAGEERTVLAVLVAGVDTGERRLGLLVDLGAEIGASAARRADEMLAAAIDSREVIDQAKGAAMLAYGLDGHAAFDLLRWHSEHLNVKVRTLAEHLLAALPGRPAQTDPRDVLDEALAQVVPSTDPEVGPLVPSATLATGDSGALPARLDVTRAAEGRAVVVRLDGVVDAATAPAMVAALADALRSVPARGQLVLDASGLSRFGSVAVVHVARLRRRAEQAGVQLRVLPAAGMRA